MTKSELKEIFREAVSEEFAHIPSEESVEYTFSDSFTKKMERLIWRQKTFYWPVVNSGLKRVAVIVGVMTMASALFTLGVREEKTQKEENLNGLAPEKDFEEGMIRPSDSDFSYIFETEEELISAVKSNTNDMIELEGLNEFYRAKDVPDNYSLDYIQVTGTSVTFRYKIVEDENYTEDSEKYYLISWYRPMNAEDLENEMVRTYSKDHIYQENLRMHKDYYIISEDMWQDVFWVQDLKVFHAVIPLDLTDEEIELFCNAEKVMINKF